jgi:DNA end-binding protein Ku
MAYERAGTIEAALQRVRREFREMPGLCLTPAQASRLWGLDAVASRALLEALVDAQFLRRTANGGFMRPDSERSRPSASTVELMSPTVRTGNKKSMARAIWTGALSFGLVNIPVELHVAVRDHRPRFRMLHATDRSPGKFERVCVRDGRPVAWADLVKGYEYSKGQFVVLTKEDFRAAALEKTHRVEIVDFVKAVDIDDRFFETPYYVVPAKAGTHAYALLRAAMQSAGRVGIAKVILRDVQHLAALEVIDDTLVLTLLRFADELADASQLPIPPQRTWQGGARHGEGTGSESGRRMGTGKHKDEYRDNQARDSPRRRAGRSGCHRPMKGTRRRLSI